MQTKRPFSLSSFEWLRTLLKSQFKQRALTKLVSVWMIWSTATVTLKKILYTLANQHYSGNLHVYQGRLQVVGVKRIYITDLVCAATTQGSVALFTKRAKMDRWWTKRQMEILKGFCARWFSGMNWLWWTLESLLHKHLVILVSFCVTRFEGSWLVKAWRGAWAVGSSYSSSVFLTFYVTFYWFQVLQILQQSSFRIRDTGTTQWKHRSPWVVIRYKDTSTGTVG